MKETTLCYLDDGRRYLMLFRDKHKTDVNFGKWIGVGGKIKVGETPREAIIREVEEETGYTLTKLAYRGLVDFISDTAENERMHLFTATAWEGHQKPCDEGTLSWVDKKSVQTLPMWEGDEVFLKLLQTDSSFFCLTLEYEGDKLVRSSLNSPTENK